MTSDPARLVVRGMGELGLKFLSFFPSFLVCTCVLFLYGTALHSVHLEPPTPPPPPPSPPAINNILLLLFFSQEFTSFYHVIRRVSLRRSQFSVSNCCFATTWQPRIFFNFILMRAPFVLFFFLFKCYSAPEPSAIGSRSESRANGLQFDCFSRP